MKKPKFFVATIISLFITFLSALRGTVIEGGGGGGEGPLVHVGMCMFLLVCWVSILALKGYILYNVLKLVVSKTQQSWLPDITN